MQTARNLVRARRISHWFLTSCPLHRERRGGEKRGERGGRDNALALSISSRHGSHQYASSKSRAVTHSSQPQPSRPSLTIILQLTFNTDLDMTQLFATLRFLNTNSAPSKSQPYSSFIFSHSHPQPSRPYLTVIMQFTLSTNR